MSCCDIGICLAGLLTRTPIASWFDLLLDQGTILLQNVDAMADKFLVGLYAFDLTGAWIEVESGLGVCNQLFIVNKAVTGSGQTRTSRSSEDEVERTKDDRRSCCSLGSRLVTFDCTQRGQRAVR